MATSNKGEFTKEDLKKWLGNLIEYTLPLFSATLFAQLAQGVSLKTALSVSLITLYGAVADYFKKRQSKTVYK